MNLVNLEAAGKAFGPRVLLDEVSLGVGAGDRIGVVGRNGAGKTTLLAALAGAAVLDTGRVTRTSGLRLGYLPQSEELAGRVGDLVFGALPKHAWAADPRTRGIAGALLGGVCLDALAERLSGGERRRAGLAAVLCQPHDLLLLDEPTNHLDIEAIDWLAGYLRGPGQAFVVVTHDRWFLDAVCERTWEVADGKVSSYEGGYSAYVLARAERARLADAADRRRRSLLRKELAWLRRGPPARTSKPKFRIDAATALIDGEPSPRDRVELTRLAAGGSARPCSKSQTSPSRPGTGRCSTTSPGRSVPATGWAWWGSTGAGRRRCCGCSPARCIRRHRRRPVSPRRRRPVSPRSRRLVSPRSRPPA